MISIGAYRSILYGCYAAIASLVPLLALGSPLQEVLGPESRPMLLRTVVIQSIQNELYRDPLYLYFPQNKLFVEVPLEGKVLNTYQQREVNKLTLDPTALHNALALTRQKMEQKIIDAANQALDSIDLQSDIFPSSTGGDATPPPQVAQSPITPPIIDKTSVPNARTFAQSIAPAIDANQNEVAAPGESPVDPAIKTTIEALIGEFAKDYLHLPPSAFEAAKVLFQPMHNGEYSKEEALKIATEAAISAIVPVVLKLVTVRSNQVGLVLEILVTPAHELVDTKTERGQLMANQRAKEQAAGIGFRAAIGGARDAHVGDPSRDHSSFLSPNSGHGDAEANKADTQPSGPVFQLQAGTPEKSEPIKADPEPNHVDVSPPD
jgi:hypothetical protein